MKQKKGIIKISALIVTVVALLVFIIINAVAVKASIPVIKDAHGSDFTDNSYVAGKLQELFELLPYSDYPYFTVTGNTSCGNSACAQCNGKNVSRMHPNLKDLGIVDNYDSWSCFAFARYGFQYIYGVQASGLNYYGNTDKNGTLVRVGRIASNTYDLSSIDGEYSDYTLSSLKALLQDATAGDILQARSRSGNTVGNHTMLFLSCDDDGIYVIQNNMYRTRTDDNGKQYGYNRVMISFMSYEAIYSTWNSIFTVYRALPDVYNDVWSQGTAICDKHTYTSAGGDYCTVCGTKFVRTIDTGCIGNYTVLTPASAYTSPYSSASHSSLNEKVVTVVDSEINSLGEMWYKLSNGSFVKSDKLTLYKPSGSVNISMTAYPIGAKKLFNSYTLKGTVTSSGAELDFVSGYFISSTGNVVQSVTVNPSGNSLSIEPSNINYSLQFGNLTIGKYIFVIVSADNNGNYAIFTSEFSIANEAGVITKTDVAAPSTSPKLSAIADTYVILESNPLYEYSKDGTTWQSSALFSDLSPLTKYTFYCRFAETELTNASPKSPALYVETEVDKTPPPAPVVAHSSSGGLEITDSTVTLKNEGSDYEYSRDGENWQTSPVFKGLSPATKYLFFKRNRLAKVSSAGCMVLTLKSTVAAPLSPAVISFSDSSIEIIYHEGYEYGIREARTSNAIDWQDPDEFNGIFEGLDPATDYYIYCIISETDSTFKSIPSEATLLRTDKAFLSSIPPRPVLVTKNSETVTLLAVPGCEYSTDGVNFTASTTFNGFTPGLTYNFVCRYAENDTYYSSENSPELNIEIIPDNVTSDVYNINEATATITGISVKTTVNSFLSDINESKYAALYDRNKKEKLGSAVICTGDFLRITDVSGVSAEYTLIVSGDTNMDGNVSLTDLLVLKEYLTTADKDKTSAIFAASDINGDGYINVVDYALMKKLIFPPDEEKQ